jgi:hypothetical protein
MNAAGRGKTVNGQALGCNDTLAHRLRRGGLASPAGRGAGRPSVPGSSRSGDLNLLWDCARQGPVTRPARTALVVVGLTIPIPAFFRLFSSSRGFRDLVGVTIASPEQELWQVPSRSCP